MSKSVLESYKQGLQILNRNLYLFWVNLAYTIPLTSISLFPRDKTSWIFALSPFIIVTLKLADTELLFTQPQSKSDIMKTYVLVLYKFLLKVIFLFTLITVIGFIIFTISGGSLETIKSYLQLLNNQDNTLVQKLLTTLPWIIIMPIIPFLKIYWVVKKESFFRSCLAGAIFAFKHPRISLIPPVMSILLIIVQHPITNYLDKSNSLIFSIINAYIGLVITSATITYFKSNR